MIPRKIRMKMLGKIAQQTPTTTVTTPPPAFIASDAWAWLNMSYNPNSVRIINNLASILNTALHYSSNGQFNFLILKNNSFQVDSSGVPSIDTKNLINLCSLIYKTLINGGNQFAQKVTPAQIAYFVQMINASQSLLNLSQINPTGTIAQKIPGNIKDNVINLLRTLQMSNPT